MATIAHRSAILAPDDLGDERYAPTMAEPGLNSLLLHAARRPEEVEAPTAFVVGERGRRLDACRGRCDGALAAHQHEDSPGRSG